MEFNDVGVTTGLALVMYDVNMHPKLVSQANVRLRVVLCSLPNKKLIFLITHTGTQPKKIPGNQKQQSEAYQDGHD